MALEAPQPPQYPINTDATRRTALEQANEQYYTSRPPYAASPEKIKAFYDLADAEAMARNIWQIGKNQEGRDMFDQVDAARKAQMEYINNPDTPYIEKGIKTNPLVQNLVGIPYYNQETQRNEYRRANGFADALLGGLYNGLALGYGAVTGNPGWKREQDTLTQENQAKLTAERWNRAKDVYDGKEPQPITPPSVKAGESIYPILLQIAGKNPTDLSPQEQLALERYNNDYKLFLDQYRSYLSRQDSLDREDDKIKKDLANAFYTMQSFARGDISDIVAATGDITSPFNTSLNNVNKTLYSNASYYNQDRLPLEYAKMYEDTLKLYNTLNGARDTIKAAKTKAGQNKIESLDGTWFEPSPNTNGFGYLWPDPAKSVEPRDKENYYIGKASANTLWPSSYQPGADGTVPKNFFDTDYAQQFFNVYRQYRDLYSSFSNYSTEDGAIPPLARTYLSIFFPEEGFNEIKAGGRVTDIGNMTYDDYLKLISNSIVNNPRFAQQPAK